MMDSDEEAQWIAQEEEEAAAAMTAVAALAPVAAQDGAAAGIKRKWTDQTAQAHENAQSTQPAHAFNLNDVISDPGIRKPIEEYATQEIRDEMRRAYLSRGPCRLIGHDFPRTKFGKDWRPFKEAWYKDFDWLEYSVEKDAAYCFYCFLFKPPSIGEKFGYGAFTKKGFKNWKKGHEYFNLHVGKQNSAHNNARGQCEDFIRNQKQSVPYAITCHVEKSHVEYEERLRDVVGIARFLVSQGLAFRGHDESSTSLNKGNFLEMVDWFVERCKGVANVMNENAPDNHKLTSPKIQKQIVQACAEETMQVVMNELGDGNFALLVDESRDVSDKGQMGVIVRFVNQRGKVLERLIGVEHVVDTKSASLKRSLDAMFVKHNLSMSRLRGQGYDGASNMRGELNELKQLVLDVNPHAFYVHCFAQQLQLVVVAVVKTVLAVGCFFGNTNKIVTMASASCRRKDDLLQKHHDKLVSQLKNGDILSGSGQHQETSLARPGDTRWGSHHRTLIRLHQMWDSVVEVLRDIIEDGDTEDRGVASGYLINMETFEFVIILHLMLAVLGLTNDLSQALQLKDQNIVSALNMIVSVKSLLQKLRDEGWEPLLLAATNFCIRRNILVPSMDDKIHARGYPRSSRKMVTNFHHYKVQIFNEVIDRNIVEMNHRFSETSTRLLNCIACLDPRDSFSSFDHERLLELAKIYSADFSSQDSYLLIDQLNIYVDVMRRSPDFLTCGSLSDLALKLVETRQHLLFPLVYRLIRLALILPAATASVERVFSSMNIIKTDLRSKIDDDWLNDMMVCFVEREIFAKISDKQIMLRFHALKNRRGHLPQQVGAPSTTIT